MMTHITLNGEEVATAVLYYLRECRYLDLSATAEVGFRMVNEADEVIDEQEIDVVGAVVIDGGRDEDR